MTHHPGPCTESPAPAPVALPARLPAAGSTATATSLMMMMMMMLAACGGGHSGPIAPGTKMQVTTSSFNLISVSNANRMHTTNDISLVPFTTTAAGTLEIDADWMSTADDVELFLYSGVCTIQEAVQNACHQLARTAGPMKPQRFLMSSLPAGTYTVSVTDFGPGAESGTMIVYLTP